MKAALMALGAALALTSPVSAWGPAGHAIIASIAQRLLTPTSAEAVRKLGGNRDDLVGIALQEEASHSEVGMPERLFDIPLTVSTGDPVVYCLPDSDGSCVLDGIIVAERDLTCALRPARRFDALRYLLHYVGELHQPLATTGADGVFLVNVPSWGKSETRQTSLYTVWDSALIARANLGWAAYARQLETGWAAKVEPAPAGSVTGWVMETHDLAIEATVPLGTVIDETYYIAHVADLNRQLTKAGRRLAAILNRALDTAPSCLSLF